jgi:hypothetical protein
MTGTVAAGSRFEKMLLQSVNIYYKFLCINLGAAWVHILPQWLQLQPSGSVARDTDHDWLRLIEAFG